ncbi:hypothetical protein JCM19037_330 [Geomicrobium sp. JCM 19037]|uniref:hypothetical protein n=1 Tax=Geomicrobium sp. JCM 19037 TaxID=1460634 RepID=UPI00045F3966|nr:hypothetical protein [Geomicrobium sp. JCM 19037]GAK02120.1 hypothetical protein JCM19037_330 [Geomicrobium sp. JCM 19037]
MKLLSYGYWRKGQVRAIFDRFPDSTVTFRPIASFYFVYMIDWSERDLYVTREDLAQMETLMNDELGLGDAYRKRKRFYSSRKSHDRLM